MKNKYIIDYEQFQINEIIITPLETKYEVKTRPSTNYNNQLDYEIYFETSSGNKYVLDLAYVIETVSRFAGRIIFNISFTELSQHDITNKTKYEKETKINEHIELMKRLIFILKEVDISVIKKIVRKPVYIIGITDNIKKINFYRNIIKDSLQTYTELKDKSTINDDKDAYYYFEK